MISSKSNLQTDIIVEARMTSSRLPGKVLLHVVDKPLLQLMIERLNRIKEVDNIIIATTVNETDDCIEQLAHDLGVLCYRGSEEDVLGRVVEAAQYFSTDTIVEITGDDPLVDPEICSKILKMFKSNENNYDIVANDFEKTFPIGLTARAFKRTLLEKVEKITKDPTNREHVESYFYQNVEKFRFYNIEAMGKLRRPDIRLTLDTKEDYQVIRSVYEALYMKKTNFTAEDVISFLDLNPAIRDLNSNISQKPFKEISTKN